MAEQIIKNTCPKCQRKTEYLFCWPRLILTQERPDDWVCFSCSSKKLKKMLDESRRLKGEIEELKIKLEKYDR